MIAAILFAAAAPSAAVPATIAEIRSNPSPYAGKWVQVEGYLNSCMSSDCGLSENLAARPINQGQSLQFEHQPTFDAWAAPLLPARVRVRARIDASCLIDMCLDRGGVLREMHVEAIETNLTPRDEDD